MTLFSAGKDSHKEKWEGARTSHDDGVLHFKADDAQPITAFPSAFKSLTSAFSNIYLDIPSSASVSRRGRGLSHKSLLKYLSSGTSSTREDYDTVVESIGSTKLKSLAPEVAKLRAIKSEAEQRIMRNAADISGDAHAKASRTYPVSGKFSSPQAALYSALLQAQKYLITLCTESARLSLAQIHRESCEMLRKELGKIGFNLTGVAAAGDLERILYPHYVGHPLGIGQWK
ncbi:hypothetical protein PHLCEN_2v8092 [Hermanssonia centrifuga]|uniref:Uncharacterized protein n=1 Tax=Hermanssonia centrifuga TaxID=98765 RepID=A0A2R6NV99_9APHY|nr:hypothetical protein PHLCEN_2v8092 [Hermanssonia centrifuga]